MIPIFNFDNKQIVQKQFYGAWYQSFAPSEATIGKWFDVMSKRCSYGWKHQKIHKIIFDDAKMKYVIADKGKRTDGGRIRWLYRSWIFG